MVIKVRVELSFNLFSCLRNVHTAGYHSCYNFHLKKLLPGTVVVNRPGYVRGTQVLYRGL